MVASLQKEKSERNVGKDEKTKGREEEERGRNDVQSGTRRFGFYKGLRVERRRTNWWYRPVLLSEVTARVPTRYRRARVKVSGRNIRVLARLRG